MTEIRINKTFRSPNHYPASYYKDVSILVIHATATDNWDSTKKWFMNPQSSASAHYVIDKNGDVYQMVDELFPSWHAGVSKWDDKDDINRHSIGIELVNNSIKPYPEEQIRALISLAIDIMKRHNISIENLVRHSDISGFRGKRDPYEHFPWNRFKLEVGDGLITKIPSTSTMSVDENSCLNKSEVSHWAKNAWEFAKQIGLINEESDPQKKLTQEEVVTMIYKFYDQVINR